MKPKLIALYSSSMGHGKSTVTTTLNSQGFTTVKLAGTLKDMLRVFLTHWGLPSDAVERCVEGDLKEVAIPAIPGVTTRHLMQTLGTDWGRTFVAPDIWVRMAMGRITRLMEAGRSVVVDDMRFPNEFDALFELGARMVKVTRPGVRVTNGHPSEGLLDQRRWDAEVINDSSLEDLELAALSLLD